MKPTITYDDFDKLDLRVGKVTAAQVPTWSAKLLEFTVDFGPELGTKTILSGIRKWYVPEDFIGKSYLFVVNLAERKMGEGVSQGMMLMVDGSAQPIIFAVPESAQPGEVVR